MRKPIWFKRRMNKCVVNGLISMIVILAMHQGIISYAAEECKTSYLYHRHIGSEEQVGGCYQQPVYHAHMGDEITGGVCYENPVYHVHEGNETSGGSCYGTAVYHTHSDHCYGVRHTHGDGCYKHIGSDVYGCYVVKFWDTDEGDYEGHDYMYYQMSCGRTLYGTNAFHYHEEFVCDGTGGTNERVLSCQKEGTVEKYKLSCLKTEEVIDGFKLSCLKSETDVEKYEQSCGKEEGIAYGMITVTKTLSENGYGATLSVRMEDLTGGELQLSDHGFAWYGEGNYLGSGESITVAQNGTYSVAVGLQNEDITGGQVSITVSDIREYVEPEPTKEPIREPITEPTPESMPEPTQEPVLQQTPEPIPESTQESAPKPTNTPILEKEKAVPTEVPLKIETKEFTLGKEAVTKKAANREIIQPTPVKTPKPTTSPIMKKETVTVKMDEKLSTDEMLPEIQNMPEKKPSVFASPVVRVITVTVGTFTAFTGLFVLYYLLRKSVAVYNDDGNGKMRYLGRCIVQESDNAYLLIIPEKMIQDAMTNRYMIKPGIFAWGKEQEELIVEKQLKRVPVMLEGKMIVVI